MKFFSHVDKIVDSLAWLGGPMLVGDVNHNLVMALTTDYMMEQRTLLYGDKTSR